MVDAALAVAALECTRADRVVFSAVSFAVRRGEILQIVGANGSGKTSLLRVLSGLAAPTAGTVHWLCEDVHRTPDRWRRTLQYLGHHAGVASTLTARENLEYAVALSGRSARMRLDDALAHVGLTTKGRTLAGRLSAGQRQRVALARLLVIPADAWLLDEPLTALDDDGKRWLEQILVGHAAAGGIAVVATHQALQLASLPPRRYELAATPE